MNLNNSYEILTKSWDVKNISLDEILKWKTILFFYPKDNTPGCTIENKDFSCLSEQFKDLGVNLVGVSKDSIDSHKKFVTNHELNVELISDPDLILHKELWAYGEKNNYGKIVMGVIRSTFLIENGEILESWKNIRAKWHAERILKALS
jgi:peroxiredoxin Q/BCP